MRFVLTTVLFALSLWAFWSTKGWLITSTTASSLAILAPIAAFIVAFFTGLMLVQYYQEWRDKRWPVTTKS